MKVTKRVFTSIDIIPDELFGKTYSGIHEYVSDKLEKHLVGRCYYQMYIEKINRIVRIGPSQISAQHRDGRAIVSVECECIGIEYMANLQEVICGLKVVSKNEGIVTLKNELVTCSVMDNQLIRFLDKGDSFPILIDSVKYQLSQGHINITGLFYEPKPKNLCYEIVPESEALVESTDPVPPFADTSLLDTLQELTAWFESYETPKLIIFYDVIIYPYKNVMKTYPTGNVKIADLIKSPPTDGYLVAPAVISKLKSIVVHTHDAATLPPNTLVIKARAHEALRMIILDHIAALQLVKLFIEHYQDPTKDKRLNSLWEIIVNKKPPLPISA